MKNESLLKLSVAGVHASTRTPLRHVILQNIQSLFSSRVYQPMTPL